MTMAFKKPLFVNVSGVNIPIFFSPECFKSALRFQPKEGDIFIATYMKCGTTWMQNLVLNILRKGKPLEHPKDFFLASPFLDQLGSEDSEKMIIRPGAYKTHLPLHKIPWSDNAKYIYVARNPKDCCVSYYHHMRQIPGYQFANATFDEYLNLFVKGEVEFGDYFDHLLPWYEIRNAPNVFFTTFENMKQNLPEVTMKVAKFINEDTAEYLKKHTDVFEKILHNCSFDVMKSYINKSLSFLYSSDSEKLLADPNVPKGRKHIIAYNNNNTSLKSNGINFIRKGRVGSWKEELTPLQNDVLKKWINEKCKNKDILLLWE
ncbi:Sulfotransferase 1C2, partial [Stegodyphus mimosarum]